MNTVKIGSILCLIITTFHCAGIQSPSGGPPDTTSPKIIETYPKPGTLQFHDNRFSFSFDKYIDRRTLQESFFISPSLGELEFEWSGKDVEILFSDSLRNNTTYVVTIGTDVKDTRNNKMAQAFSLPFSTGNRIDSASMSGIVHDDKPDGIMIFAYQLDSRISDTLNPSKVKPDYLTQTGKDGSFLLPYLAFGTYRVIAVRDAYKNLLYEPQIDKYGTFSSDIMLSSDSLHRIGIQFRLIEEDTAAPFLSSARAIDWSHVLLRFSESMEITSGNIDSVSIVDTLSNTSLNVFDFSFTETPYKEAQIVTDKQEIDRVYRVLLNGFKDVKGNLMKIPTNMAEFNSSLNSDTSKPEMKIKNIRNNSKEIPIDDTIHIQFSEAVLVKSFENGFKLTDSLDKKVEGRFRWQNSTEAFFIPLKRFYLGMWYTIKIQLDSVIDYSGNSFKDSISILKFQTVEEKVLSSISGTVIDENQKQNILVNAINISKKQTKPYWQVADSIGKFLFENLFEGMYILSAFHDADSNGSYSFGKPFPFTPAERYSIYSDTLKLRARWPLEGVNIRLK
ncbi:MAG: Ig-like domain-containing protein [Bacteroidota bacterium]|nr:Ig-like domain-containing protein [Bacteroidota bacterium]